MVDYRAYLREAGVDAVDKDAVIDALRRSHGDVEDAKTTLLFIADEIDERVDADDIEAVTDEPPTATFT